MVWSLIAIFILGTVVVSNGQCDEKDMNITSGNGEISSPNNLNEYGRTANCSWNFTPSEGYALVLTITYQRLYIVAPPGRKICLGSYVLSINNDAQDCWRYLDAKYSHALTNPFEYFCAGDARNKSSVHVQYISDGRTYTGSENVITAAMGFSIQYKFSQCSTVTARAHLDTTNAPTTTHYPSYPTTDVVNTVKISPNTANLEVVTRINAKTTGFKIRPEIGITSDRSTITLSQNTMGTVSICADRHSSTSGMSQTTLILLLSIPEFIFVLLMIVAGIAFYRKRRSQRSDHVNTAQGTVPNSTEMGNISSKRQNGTSGTDGYEEVQVGPSGEYEEIRQATDGYEKVQIGATDQEQESGYKATYVNVA
ncbi:uncharacterized protein LOC144424300 [Styela clava]